MARRRRPLLAFGLLAALAAPPAAGLQEAQPPPAPPPPPGTAPAPARPRLKLDIGKAIAEVMERARQEGLPRFEESMEVRDRAQDAVEDRLRGVDLECGAPETGPPTGSEMNPYRSAAIPPHADFLAAGKALFKATKKALSSATVPRYFLYAVHRRPAPEAASTAEAAPVAETVSYVLREGPVAEGARASVSGTSWELIASFGDRGEAAAALKRLENGFASPQREHEDGRLPPWVATTCRPPRLK